MSRSSAPLFSIDELDEAVDGLRAYGDAAPWDGSLEELLGGLLDGWTRDVDQRFDQWQRAVRAARPADAIAHSYVRRARGEALAWLVDRIEHLQYRDLLPRWVDAADSAARILLAFEGALMAGDGMPREARRADVLGRIAVQVERCASGEGAPARRAS